MNALKIEINQPLLRFGKLVLMFCMGGIFALGVGSSPLAAQQSRITQAQIVEIVSGNEVYIQSKKAKEKDIAKKQQQVRTGKARTELEFNNKAIARLGNNSSLLVGGCGVELAKGTVLINGAVSGCTSTISAGVRGTTYLLSIDEEGDEQIRVLEGEVEVISRTQDEQPDTDIIRELVNSGQVFSISPRSGEFNLRSLTADEFIAILEGELFKGYRRELASLKKIHNTYRQLFPDLDLPASPKVPSRVFDWRRRIGR